MWALYDSIRFVLSLFGLKFYGYEFFFQLILRNFVIFLYITAKIYFKIGNL